MIIKDSRNVGALSTLPGELDFVFDEVSKHPMADLSESISGFQQSCKSGGSCRDCGPTCKCVGAGCNDQNMEDKENTNEDKPATPNNKPKL